MMMMMMMMMLMLSIDILLYAQMEFEHASNALLLQCKVGKWLLSSGALLGPAVLSVVL